MLFPTPTQSQAEQRAKAILGKANSDFAQMVSDHKLSFGMLWNSDDPAAVLAAMGNDAGKALRLAWARVEFILSIDPSVLQLDEYMPLQPLAFNDDGTVEIKKVTLG